MGDLFQPWHLLILTVLLLFSPVLASVWAIPPFWRILKKTGFAPSLSVLMCIPIVNLILLYVVGFSARLNTYPTNVKSTLPPVRNSFLHPSEGVRRLGIALGIITATLTFIAFFAAAATGTQSPLVLIPCFILSLVVGLVVSGLVLLIAWTIAGFRTQAESKAARSADE
jgi:hypothetical protein